MESYNDEDDGGEGVYDGNMCDVMDDGARVRCQDQCSSRDRKHGDFLTQYFVRIVTITISLVSLSQPVQG